MTRKMLLSLLVVGVLGTLAGVGTYAAFSGSTQSSGNRFVAGTVAIGDNDLDGALYELSATPQKPGQNVVKCVKVTYTGNLDADVKLYTTSSVNAASQYVNLTVDKGTSDTSTFPNCGTFDSEATIFSGTLKGFADTKNSYDNGIAANPGSSTKWSSGNSLVYRFTLSVQDVTAAQGADTGSHGFTFEARNQ
ncbi:MAG TPA: TasA family protein [Actinomycetota bacterium]|nr:TasA family protein [Actinomycetota bacterium]